MIEIRHNQVNSNQSLQSAYDIIYADHGINHLESLYLWLINLLKPEQGKNLLDVSCGEGSLVRMAGKINLHAFGFDLSPVSILKSRLIDPAGLYYLANGEKIPTPGGSFDYVTHIGSLEHYLDPQAGALEISRVLKMGGKACILLPNTFGLWGNILNASRKGDVHDDGQPIQRYGTRNAWTGILEKGGLEILEVHGYAGSGLVLPRTWHDLGWLAARPLKVLKLILNIFVPVNLANHLVFICTPRPG